MEKAPYTHGDYLISLVHQTTTMKAPSITKSASLWFGAGASRDERKALAADMLAAMFAASGLAAGGLFLRTWASSGRLGSERLLFELVIPASAISAGLVGLLIRLRTAARAADAAFPSDCRQQFGRKGLMVSSCSLLFIASCCYRALNVADEGASMCRGRATPFNAPVAGRAVATVGEIALVVQISTFLDDTSHRLGIANDLWSRRRAFTMAPVICAECFSWAGVLSGISRFYCCEYLLWMCISLAWAWDAAECLHKSERFSDVVTHATVLLGGLALFAFNALLEIPHFFRYHPSDTVDASTVEVLSIFECFHDRDSPLWIKRLPFFFSYFFGCSWFSAALSYRYLRRGMGSAALKQA